MTFDSTKQAANALNLPVFRLRLAKEFGCPAFRNGRVYPGLIDWLRKNMAQLNQYVDWPESKKLTDETLDRAQTKLDEIEASLKAAKANK